MKLVRLKPYDPKRGHVIRRYTVYSIRFEERRGWYRVEDEVAEYLKTVHQIYGDEYSPNAFDVCTEEEANQIDVEEKKKAEERARAGEPNIVRPRDATSVDLSTADLAKSSRSREKHA